MSCTPGEVSSVILNMGRRTLETILSPTLGNTLDNEVRVWAIERNSSRPGWQKAQKSQTWVPWVFCTSMVWPCATLTATPQRAGTRYCVSSIGVPSDETALLSESLLPSGCDGEKPMMLSPLLIPLYIVKFYSGGLRGKAFHDLGVGGELKDRGRDFNFDRAAAPAQDNVVALHHFTVDHKRQGFRQSQRGDAADLHAGEGFGFFGRGKRAFLYAHFLAHAFVDIKPGGGKQHAGGVLPRVGFACRDDHIGRDLGRNAVVLTEECGISKFGIAIHHLVFDAKGFQCSQHFGSRVVWRIIVRNCHGRLLSIKV